ncbi:MAG: carbon-nitrogen hydrolase family protein [Pseudomonadota bacterium]
MAIAAAGLMKTFYTFYNFCTCYTFNTFCLLVLSLQASVYCTASEVVDERQEPATFINVALLHIAPVLGDLSANTALVARAMTDAKRYGADWVMTPELALTGYKFAGAIGTDWFVDGPDEYVRVLQNKADELNMVLFLSHLEQDQTTGSAYNTLFVIDRDGEIIARHRKINTIPVAEDWSAQGEHVNVAQVDDIRLGLLICADAWPPDHTAALSDQGVDVILSSATWPPGRYGPGDVWERRSLESDTPFIVNNRTGIEGDFDMRKSQSVIAVAGRRLLEFQSNDNALVVISFDLNDASVSSQKVYMLEAEQ